jgi:hypothetical protein
LDKPCDDIGSVKMDRITKSQMEEFINQAALGALQEDTAFEYFSGYLVTSKHQADASSPEDICVGAGGDCGIDCVAFLVNGALVTEPQEIEDLCATNGYLDVACIFTQAERSASFDTAKIGQFAFGVKDFFSEHPRLPQNDAIIHKHTIWSAIFERNRFFKKGNPQCFLYYITTGRWTNDQNLVTRKDAERQDIDGLGLFRQVIFDCVDAAQLQRLYRESQNAITRQIIFADRTVIPEIPGVDQAFLGLLSATEYLKLIEGDNNDIVASIFDDNVRHWQDWNQVNTEMKDTLNCEKRILFPLLNNGVTVVANRVTSTGNRYVLEDYQVVNGCQTSFVLHECRAALTEQVMIPVRLIATRDEDIKNSIIKATNRQTPVTDEQFFALSEFPKRLEAFFKSFEPTKRLYYERRSRQYNATANVERVRVINITNLVRSFASMFLRIPQRTTRNYKSLLKQMGTEIFGPEHRLEAYYVAAFAQYKLEYYFRTSAIPADLKPARFQILLAYKMLVQPAVLPRMNSHDMQHYCEVIMEDLWDDASVREHFQRAAGHVRAVANGNLYRDNIHTEQFTNALLAHIAVAP